MYDNDLFVNPNVALRNMSLPEQDAKAMMKTAETGLFEDFTYVSG